MTLKDFTTEQLEFIKSRFDDMYALEEFINGRKNGKSSKIDINVNDCFYEELSSDCFTLYRIVNINKTKKIVEYDEIILDINQMYTDTYNDVKLTSCHFDKMKKFDLDTFSNIWQKLNDYTETVNELHGKAYEESIVLLEKWNQYNT